MSSDIPVLKPELQMALPIEAQPKVDQAAARLYEDAHPAVVKIATDKSRPGSGFLVDESHILTTARNVVGSKEQFAFGPNGKRYKLELEKLDDIADLALLRIRNGSIPGTKSLPLGETNSLDADSKLFGLSTPRDSGSTRPYLSPGYARGLSSPIDLLLSLDPELAKALETRFNDMDKTSAEDAAHYLSQPLIETKMHVEMGSIGGPVLDKDGKVVAVTALSSAADLRSGQTLALPVESVRDLLGEKSKFQFEYKAKAADWAEEYKHNWLENRTKAIADTVMGGLFSGLAIKGAQKYPFIAGSGIGLYGLTKLTSDANHLLNSTDTIDGIKYGIAAGADLGTVGGAAMMLAPKLKGYGIALAGASLLVRAGSDFIQNRWVLDETKRTEAKDPQRKPFSLDDLLGQ